MTFPATPFPVPTTTMIDQDLTRTSEVDSSESSSWEKCTSSEDEVEAEVGLETEAEEKVEAVVEDKAETPLLRLQVRRRLFQIPPMERLPLRFIPALWSKPPVMRYGVLLSLPQIIDYADQHSLSTPKWTRRHYNILGPFKVVKHIAATCNIPILLFAHPRGDDYFGMVALHDNYRQYSSVAPPDSLKSRVQRIQAALGVDHPAKWYLDANAEL